MFCSHNPYAYTRYPSTIQLSSYILKEFLYGRLSSR
nr:MAG TPA: hypothetical protein [Caudoviricetes sp.]